ncbi:hypothetical protein WJX82_009319 [Trebouxia sp. C0006]
MPTHDSLQYASAKSSCRGLLKTIMRSQQLSRKEQLGSSFSQMNAFENVGHRRELHTTESDSSQGVEHDKEEDMDLLAALRRQMQ